MNDKNKHLMEKSHLPPGKSHDIECNAVTTCTLKKAERQQFRISQTTSLTV